MTEDMTKDGEVRREISALTSGVSPTAASKENPLYGPSGSMKYRVLFREGGHTDVVAASGDLAAEAALRECPGKFVTNVFPAGA